MRCCDEGNDARDAEVVDIRAVLLSRARTIVISLLMCDLAAVKLEFR